MFNYSDKVNYGPKASQSHSKKALSQQKKEWWHAGIKKIKTKPYTYKPKCHGALQTAWWHGSQIAFKRRTVQPKCGH